MQAWHPGEFESVGDPYKPDWGVSTFTESWDRARGLYRLDWMRRRVTGGMRNYTEIFSNEVGNRMGGGQLPPAELRLRHHVGTAAVTTAGTPRRCSAVPASQS